VAFRWVGTAALLLVMLLFGAARADSSVTPFRDGGRGRVGISTSTVWLPAGEGYTYLQRARKTGITWIREDFAWSTIEPQRGHVSWRHTDALMRNASRLGISVLAIATYAPGWATGHSDSDKYAPTNPRDFAAFVRAIAERYGKGGTFWRSNPRLAPAPLTAIEIWNEPWLSDFWRPAPDPTAYARLVRATAVAVKARHPGITLLASGDVSAQGEGAGTDWLDPLLRADPALWRSGLVGAWSVHLYCQELSPWDTAAPQRSRFDRMLLTRSLAQLAGADKPIWITEFGWNTDPESPAAVSEEIQAQYLRDALVRAGTEWQSFVPRSFVFTWTKPSPGDDYNLLRPDGSARPAWYAIEAFITTGA
jgi:polysaccharide biosynthesis protein PslG